MVDAFVFQHLPESPRVEHWSFELTKRLLARLELVELVPLGVELLAKRADLGLGLSDLFPEGANRAEYRKA